MPHDARLPLRLRALALAALGGVLVADRPDGNNDPSAPEARLLHAAWVAAGGALWPQQAHRLSAPPAHAQDAALLQAAASHGLTLLEVLPPQLQVLNVSKVCVVGKFIAAPHVTANFPSILGRVTCCS